jgi:hypothetical protein
MSLSVALLLARQALSQGVIVCLEAGAQPATPELRRWAFDPRPLSHRLGSVVKSIPLNFFEA